MGAREKGNKRPGHYSFASFTVSSNLTQKKEKKASAREQGSDPKEQVDMWRVTLTRLEARPASHPRVAKAPGTHREEGSSTFREGVGVILARRGSLACGKMGGGGVLLD